MSASSESPKTLIDDVLNAATPDELALDGMGQDASERNAAGRVVCNGERGGCPYNAGHRAGNQEMSASSESPTTLIDDVLNAATPDGLELALARVMRHPGITAEERREFYRIWEELSDLLLERWHDLCARRDVVAWGTLHRRGSLAMDTTPGAENTNPDEGHGDPRPGLREP